MASHTHEAVAELLCEAPLFVRDLLSDCLGVELPPFASVTRDESKLTELVISEFRIDGVLAYRDETGRPITLLGIEVQLQPDDDKGYSWPAYVVLTRARHRCPTDLLIVTLDESTADWAERTIPIGTLNTFRAFVLGPKQIPRVQTSLEAARNPELAFLSALAHSRSPEGAPVVRAALDGLADPGVEHRRAAYYRDVIQQSLTTAMQKLVEALMPYPGYQPQSEYSKGVFQGLAEGEAKGLASAVLAVLSARGLSVAPEQEQRIRAADVQLLEQWVRRAALASSVDELFPPTH